jgi:hypothetical protein
MLAMVREGGKGFEDGVECVGGSDSVVVDICLMDVLRFRSLLLVFEKLFRRTMRKENLL